MAPTALAILILALVPSCSVVYSLALALLYFLALFSTTFSSPSLFLFLIILRERIKHYPSSLRSCAFLQNARMQLVDMLGLAVDSGKLGRI